ncbi:MAG TPA: TetR/AcrR family transcriptional regulator [Afipia sp.]
MSVFWRQGYAATSTEDLLQAMKVGRQSMYDTFGDKRRLYVEALARYQRESTTENIRRLQSTASPLAGVEAMISGLFPSEKAARERGCMGINSISEFGHADLDLNKLRAENGRRQHVALIERLSEAQATGEISKAADLEQAARFVETTMTGLQIAAKAGAGAKDLRDTAAFAINLLKVT